MPDCWRPDFDATPPFGHLAGLLHPIALREGGGWPSLAHLNRLAGQMALTNAHALPLRFVPQSRRCGQRDYEAGILASGEVPTREENWHDLLNALSWLSLPRIKQTLNALQCQALEPGARQRGALSDAATLFDESGLVLAGPDPSLAADLAARRWRRACVERRQDWAEVTVLVVGHGVLEKLLAPWPGITAKCTFIPLPGRPGREVVDQALAQHWQAGHVSRPADLFPLPVLGVPGWWPGNADPAFYDNANVFRPARA